MKTNDDRIRIVVAGNRGFIGSAVTAMLSRLSPAPYVVGIDRSRANGKDPNVNQQIFASINGGVADLIPGFDPHVVINMAGEPDVGLCEAHPEDSIDSNVMVTEHLLRYAKINHVARFVHASSAAVYSRNPEKVYARDKMLAEYLVITAPIPQRANLRFFNVYGPGSNHGVISRWSSALARGEIPRLSALPETVRDFIHVEDVARAVVRAATLSMDKDCSFTADICTGIGTTLFRLAEIMGLDMDGMAFAPVDPGESDFSIGEPEKAFRYFGWKPKIYLHEGIGSTIEYHRRNL